ncbi:MAG: hypothetical protein WA510_02455 [Acidobacteriaceae bacterium]
MALNKRTALLLGIGLVVSGLIVGVLVFAQHWNSPTWSRRSLDIQTPFDGKVWVTTVSCFCPEYILQGTRTPAVITLSISTQEGQPNRAPVTPIRTEAGSAEARVAGLPGVPSRSKPSAAGPESTETPLLLYLFPSLDGSFVTFDGGTRSLMLIDPEGTPGLPQVAKVTLNSRDGPVQVGFTTSVVKNGKWMSDLRSAAFSLEMRPPFSTTIYPFLVYGAIIAVVSSLVFFVDSRLRRARAIQEAKVTRAKELAEAHPERPQFTWQLAQARLEKYFDGNLAQVRLVFWLAVAVMAAGFGVVLWAIGRSVTAAKEITPGAGIAIGAGVITQFLGATFLVLYRSTMQQADQFILVLDRINNVGMAVQVLDQIPDNPPELKTQARMKIIEHLATLKDPQIISAAENHK